MEDRRCENCGKPFKPRKATARFCSMICRGQGVSKTRRNHPPPSEETREKIRAAQLGKVNTPEQRAKMSAAHKGVPLSEEHRRNLKAALPSGARHSAWKGDAVGYAALHHWLSRHYQKTGTCELCGTRPSRTEWSNVSGEYRREDRADWQELCVPCHRHRDAR